MQLHECSIVSLTTHNKMAQEAYIDVKSKAKAIPKNTTRFKYPTSNIILRIPETNVNLTHQHYIVLLKLRSAKYKKM